MYDSNEGEIKHNVIDTIVRECSSMYEQLPKNGKPSSSEYTILAAVIKIHQSPKFDIISLSTGTKCIGAINMCPKGHILNDLHAEVMARRGFLIYLYENIDNAYQGKDSIFTIKNNLCKLKSGIKFALYSSKLPCGDASIVPKTDASDDEVIGDIVTSLKRKHNEIDQTECKSKDIHRTGAKCLPHAEQDPKYSGVNYHLLGQVRTKPGRGQRTLSVSCSDKIARWIHLGIQGSLINMLLMEPIYLSYLIFGPDERFCKKTLQRALLYRDNPDIKMKCLPKFYQCELGFVGDKYNETLRPAPASLLWVGLRLSIQEVAHGQGYKWGCTKKHLHQGKGRLSICKSLLFQRFMTILAKNEELKNCILGDVKIDEAKYDEVKSKSKDYIEKWSIIKDNVFKVWTVKPKIWNFTCNNK